MLIFLKKKIIGFDENLKVALSYDKRHAATCDVAITPGDFVC